MPPAGGGAPPMGGPETSGLPNQSPSDLPPVVGDSVRSRRVLSEDDYNKQIEKLVYNSSIEPERKKESKNKKIISENNKINDKLNRDAENMINEIDNLLKKNISLNGEQKIIDSEDVEINDIGDLEV